MDVKLPTADDLHNELRQAVTQSLQGTRYGMNEEVDRMLFAIGTVMANNLKATVELAARAASTYQVPPEAVAWELLKLLPFPERPTIQ